MITVDMAFFVCNHINHKLACAVWNLFFRLLCPIELKSIWRWFYQAAKLLVTAELKRILSVIKSRLTESVSYSNFCSKPIHSLSLSDSSNTLIPFWLYLLSEPISGRILDSLVFLKQKSTADASCLMDWIRSDWSVYITLNSLAPFVNIRLNLSIKTSNARFSALVWIVSYSETNWALLCLYRLYINSSLSCIRRSSAQDSRISLRLNLNALAVLRDLPSSKKTTMYQDSPLLRFCMYSLESPY